ncbi:MAG TPA: hypothetical protein GXZ82_15255 [Firmicutes bacterium]|jgi:hypothetical protein|nr:hypothetical protein [Bacillota bacterium]
MSPWALGAIIQVLATLLGLVLAAYVLFHDRAELSLDYLQRKQAFTARQLAAILPALTKRFSEFESHEPYWQETYRNLYFLSVALTKIVPEMDCDSLAAIQLDQQTLLGEMDVLAADEVAHLVNNPEAFFLSVLSISKLAPLEPGYPQRSVLNAYRREYKMRLARHLHIVQRANWLNKGPGRLLPLMLMLTLVFSICLLLFTEMTTPIGFWSRNALLALLLLCSGTLVVTLRRLLQPAGRILRPRNLLVR